MSATGQVGRRTKFEPLAPGFLHVDPPYCYRCPLKRTYPECGVACVEAAIRAWISTSTGRLPSMLAKTLAPLTSPGRCDRNRTDGLATSISPAADISKTPISSASP